MELTNLPVFGIMRSKLHWLNQRKEVLARNIANADTPNYAAHDLVPFTAKNAFDTRRTNFGVNVVQTSTRHLAGRRTSTIGDFKEAPEVNPYETAPAGNAVILEEQMIKVSQSQVQHKLMTQLYKKQLGMIKMVVRGGGG